MPENPVPRVTRYFSTFSARIGPASKAGSVFRRISHSAPTARILGVSTEPHPSSPSSLPNLATRKRLRFLQSASVPALTLAPLQRFAAPAPSRPARAPVPPAAPDSVPSDLHAPPGL